MGPLTGMRVVELGHALAAPFAGSLLGDFGADIIKIEQPGHGDSLRAMGPQLDSSSVWWSVTGRNKRSVCIDFKKPRGLELVRALLEDADVLVENFRPGVLDRAGLGWEELHAAYPQLIMLSISGYGRGGPYSDRPGFGKIAEAFSGATHLTGEAEQPPTHPGYSLGDATTGLMGAFGIMVAMHERARSGIGQSIDLALYETLFRMIEWQIPLNELQGWEVHRTGTQFPFNEAFLTDICATSDGYNIVISAATTKSLASIRSLLLEHDLITDTAATVLDMAPHLRAWVKTLPRDEAMRVLRHYDVVVGPVHGAADMTSDPHLAARGNIVTAADSNGRSIPMPNVVPMLQGTPGEVRWAGPNLGEHSGEVMSELLGLDEAQIAQLVAEGVIA
ncbi:MAG: hypothetical protein JWQ19_1287 [Subtercola sp.]|nr:hypothetical protein [Subtercola sp.]